jgi:hypothetical protein
VRDALRITWPALLSPSMVAYPKTALIREVAPSGYRNLFSRVMRVSSSADQ